MMFWKTVVVSPMSDGGDGAAFEEVDWEDVSRTGRLLTPERVVLCVGLVLFAAVFVYERRFVRLYLVGNWRVEPVDWVFLCGLVVLAAYGVVPLYRNRRFVANTLGRLRDRPLAILAGVYVLAFALVGLLGPVVYQDPSLDFGYMYQPPLGFSAEFTSTHCAGEVTGDAFERRCHGSWAYPLGTNHRGHSLGYLLAEGARIALYVVVFTAVFVVPVATALGVVAGFRGGIVDDVLMTAINVQLSIPAIVLYFVGYAIFNPSLLLLLVTFGLLSWGGITRLVRSETLQRREQGHVLVARSLGAPSSYVATRHVLPNVTNTVVPAVFQLFALLVLIEAGIAFLGFHELEMYSWGSTISESINAQIAGQHQVRADRPAHRIWWISTLPMLALTLVLVSFKVVGDALRDALDPRQ